MDDYIHGDISDEPGIDNVISLYNESIGNAQEDAVENKAGNGETIEAEEDLFFIDLEGSSSNSGEKDPFSPDVMSVSDGSGSDAEWDLDNLVCTSNEEEQNNSDSIGLSSQLLQGSRLTANLLNDGMKYSDGQGTPFSAKEIATARQKEVISSSGSSRDPFQLNFFYLLAKFGNFLLPPSVAKEGMQWSSPSEWYLCSITRNGNPWDISDASGFFKRLVSFSQSESDLSYAKSIRLQTNICGNILQNDWEIYQRNRMLLMQSKGQQFFLNLLRANDLKCRHVSLKDKFGCLFFKNSCTLDALLFVFPHIHWSIYKQGLFGRTENKISYAAKVPGTILFSIIMRDLFSISSGQYRRRFHEKISNVLRVLMQDLSSFYRARGKPLPRMWSPFVDNEFLNINEVIWYILPRLLGAENHTSVSSKLRFEKITIRDEHLKTPHPSPQFAELVCKLLKSRKPESDGFFEGLCAVQFDGKIETEAIKVAQNLLGHVSTYFEAEKVIKVIAFLGYERKSQETHFISGVMFKDGESRDRIYVYDGMKDEGKPKGMTLFTAFKKKNSVFSIPALYAFVVCSKAEIID